MFLGCHTSVLVYSNYNFFLHFSKTLNYVLGRGSGSFFGGLLIGSYGTRISFRLMGLLGIVSGTVYGLLHCMWLYKFEDKTINEKAGKF